MFDEHEDMNEWLPAGADALSEKQRFILASISKFQQVKGYSPSLREIGEMVGLSAVASVISTAASTAAGIPDGCKVGFSTASGTLDVLSYRQSATLADRVAATSSSVSIAWMAIGI